MPPSTATTRRASPISWLTASRSLTCCVMRAWSMPADDNRLVQRWSWFGAYYEPFSGGDLFDAAGLPTPLMETLRDVLVAAP
ncbi:MAG: hypothetical protein R2851_05680 [Caldilineaceae bacterium]